MMRRRRFLLASAAAACVPVDAQPTAYRIACVTTERRNAPSANLDALRAGLKELDLVERHDIVIDVWSGDCSSEGVQRILPDALGSRPDPHFRVTVSPVLLSVANQVI